MHLRFGLIDEIVNVGLRFVDGVSQHFSKNPEHIHLFPRGGRRRHGRIHDGLVVLRDISRLLIAGLDCDEVLVGLVRLGQADRNDQEQT